MSSSLLEIQETEIESIDIKNWVTKSNELIESTYKLSLQEQRILLVLASKVQPADETLKTYRFRAKDFIEIIGNKKGTGFYSYLKETVNGLQTKVLTIKTGGKQRNYNWLITSIYEDNEGYITLQFHPELKHFFLALKEKFTTYQLENVVRLNSVYSIRIYELLKQYEKIKKREFSIEELRRILAIGPSKYQQYGHFKSKVLLVAQKEINAKTDICFEINELKTGRKVTRIEFIIKSQKANRSIEEMDSPIPVIEGDNKSITISNDYDLDSVKVQLESSGLSIDEIDSVINHYPSEQILQNIKYTLEKYNEGKINHLKNYMLKAIKANYANNKRINKQPTRVEKVPEYIEQSKKESDIIKNGTFFEKEQLYLSKRGTQEEFETFLLQVKELKMRIHKKLPREQAEVIGDEAIIQALTDDINKRLEIGLHIQPVEEFINHEIREIYKELITENI